MSKPSMLAAGMFLAGSLAAAIPADASHYSVVYSFKGGADGAEPFSGLVDVGGTLYGTTWTGGAANDGTVFAVTPAGGETVVYSFKGGADGVNPYAGLLPVGGALYGATETGGANNLGTVFAVTPAGSETVLYSFRGGLDGTLPVGGLIKKGAVLYGTTSGGGDGSACGTPGCGTVFKITTAGVESVVFRFGNYEPDAVYPLGTLLASDGELYGTTYNSDDAATPLGAVFETTGKGTESVLHLFGSGTDGADPVGGLIEVNGTSYGTTESGGANEYGTVFSLTPAGVETVMYSFKGGKDDGAGPQAALIDVGGTLYGTTGNGGRNNNYSYGTVFKISMDGKESLMHKFGPLAGPDGSVPLSDLIEVGGKLYGTTYGGGANGYGTVFEIKP
ncbi:MAG TPA: choice-of-anchor tandem repeat GloVer-containing protein [Rhizomicrobium sp.]|jgi:uncharacterized repeat protein (TIGR03803 family)|nr:choice-of-anchor tandem repeat GloVer-containing protein [Rhizomicrobium sp.]